MADESHFGGWWVTQECLEVEASEANGPSPQSWIEMKKIILLANPGYAFEPGTTFSHGTCLLWKPKSMVMAICNQA